jgi:hypothetical protein
MKAQERAVPVLEGDYNLKMLNNFVEGVSGSIEKVAITQIAVGNYEDAIESIDQLVEQHNKDKLKGK